MKFGDYNYGDDSYNLYESPESPLGGFWNRFFSEVLIPDREDEDENY